MGIFKEIVNKGVVGFCGTDSLFIKPGWAKPGDLFIDSESSINKEFVMDALKKDASNIARHNKAINPTFMKRINYLTRTHIIPKPYNYSYDPGENTLEFNRMILPHLALFKESPSIIKNGIKAYKLADGEFVCFPVVNGVELKSLPTVQYFKDLYKKAVLHYV